MAGETESGSGSSANTESVDELSARDGGSSEDQAATITQIQAAVPFSSAGHRAWLRQRLSEAERVRASRCGRVRAVEQSAGAAL